MNVKAFLCGCLSIILLNLLGSISISIHPPTFIHGLVSEESMFTTVVEPNRFVPAEFTSDSGEKVDSIVFVGDVLLARNIEFLMENKGSGYPYKGIDFTEFSFNQAVIGNFEAAIPRIHVPTETMQINFSVDQKFLPAAKNAGFTHFSLANNHSNDFGISGRNHTISALTNNGISTFGHPVGTSKSSVSLIEGIGQTVSVIGLHTLEKIPSKNDLTSLFSYANKESDIQIVYVHWGTEYSNTSNSRQKKIAKKLVDAGADLIIGHHPHVVQEVDYIDSVPVFYSLGNYIFDQYSDSETQEGLLLQLSLFDEPTIHLIPITSEETPSQPNLMNKDRHQEFLTKLANKSHSDLSMYIESGMVPLDILVATSPKIAMIGL